MSNQDHTVNALNELLEKNYDALNGYENAADNVKEPALKNFFHERAGQRSRFASELDSEIRGLNGSPKERGSAAGALHRTWMDIKSTFSKDNSEATLEECIRGEKASVENYREVINDERVPEQVKSRLQHQVREVEEALSNVRSMEDLRDQ